MNQPLRKLSLEEEDALELIRSSLFLETAWQSKNPAEIVGALDHNLQMWVAIRTFACKKEHTLPDDTKQNLIRLADFVAQKTFEHGKDIPERTIKTFINTNLQISEGLLEAVHLSPVEKDALALVEVAAQISQAYDDGNSAALHKALEDNVKLWIVIKTLARKPNCPLPHVTRDNLIKLAEFVTENTFSMNREIKFGTLETFINTNLQIAEGLLEGATLSTSEQDAMALVRAAIMLAQAKDNKDKRFLVQALDHNLQLWVAIRTLVSKENHTLAASVRENLKKLADFVTHITFEKGAEMDDKSIDLLINANLQIAEGLLKKRTLPVNQ